MKNNNYINKEDMLVKRTAICWAFLESTVLANVADAEAKMQVTEAIGFLKNQMEPLYIEPSDLAKIKDFGIDAFHETKALPDGTREMQVYLVLRGLIEYLLVKHRLPAIKVDVK